MKRVSKKRKEILSKFDLAKSYSLADACDLVKDITTSKFDASVDICVRLGVDPRKADQMVRGAVVLPNGLGKSVRVLVFAKGDKVQEAEALITKRGSDYMQAELANTFKANMNMLTQAERAIAASNNGRRLFESETLPSSTINAVTTPLPLNAACILKPN